MRTAGRPMTATRSMSGMAFSNVLGGSSTMLTTSAYVSEMATGRTTVPSKSINTTNCIEKQNVPQRFRTRTSSMRL